MRAIVAGAKATSRRSVLFVVVGNAAERIQAPALFRVVVQVRTVMIGIEDAARSVEERGLLAAAHRRRRVRLRRRRRRLATGADSCLRSQMIPSPTTAAVATDPTVVPVPERDGRQAPVPPQPQPHP